MALNDPNFGSRDVDPSAPQSVSKLSDPSFGSKKPASDPYGQTRETLGSKRQEREERAFERKFRREAKYGRISNDTRAKLINNALNDYINRVISEKQSSTRSINNSATDSSSLNLPTVVNSPPPNVEIPSGGGGVGGRAKLPSTVEIEVCVDGEPALLRVYGEIIEEEE